MIRHSFQGEGPTCICVVCLSLRRLGHILVDPGSSPGFYSEWVKKLQYFVVEAQDQLEIDKLRQEANSKAAPPAEEEQQTPREGSSKQKRRSRTRERRREKRKRRSTSRSPPARKEKSEEQITPKNRGASEAATGSKADPHGEKKVENKEKKRKPSKSKSLSPPRPGRGSREKSSEDPSKKRSRKDKGERNEAVKTEASSEEREIERRKKEGLAPVVGEKDRSEAKDSTGLHTLPPRPPSYPPPGHRGRDSERSGQSRNKPWIPAHQWQGSWTPKGSKKREKQASIRAAGGVKEWYATQSAPSGKR